MGFRGCNASPTRTSGSLDTAGEHTRLACWLESLAVASRPLQWRLAETSFADSNLRFNLPHVVSRPHRAVAFSEGVMLDEVRFRWFIF
jgi:hypothetical protein